VYQFLDEISIPEWKRTEKPVRVAVLDTGINLNDPFIQANKARIQCMNFLRDQDGGPMADSSGHGTHVAGLVLKVARNASLYVARIARSHDDLDDEAIAKAIRYAIDIWQVDIISMSFGYRSSEPAPEAIREAIRDAYRANIVMFAAGNNYGGNEPIAFPANQREVICVGATNHEGKKSSFTPWAKGNAHFRTFGEKVVSSGVEKTGTSYATPIAAGIAAISLDYIGRLANPKVFPYPVVEKPEQLQLYREERARLIGRAKTLSGMISVLRELSEVQDDGCYYIAPWSKMERRQTAELPGLLLNCLRHI
ncbi:subtilisin-like protein, partial [Thozetella sp. PMI_491]